MSAALAFIISLLPSDVQDFAFAIFNELLGLITGLSALVNVPFAAGNFGGTGALTWTLTAGDQVTFSYTLNGKVITLYVQLTTTTVGGTVAGNNLTIKIPNGLLAAKTFNQVGNAAPAGAANEQVIIGATAGSNLLVIARNNANWVVGADNTTVNFMAVIPVQ